MKKQIAWALMATLFTSSIAVADTVADDAETRFEQIIAEDEQRRLEEEKKLAEEEVAIEEEAAPQEPQETLAYALLETIGGKAGYPYPDEYYLQKINQDAYYHLVAVNDDYSVVQLHDGSKWSVAYYDRAKVAKWVGDDNLFIKPCISWFSTCRYVIHNRALNMTVEVNLKSAPLDNCAYTYSVIDICLAKSYVLLSDQTIWRVNDSYTFPKWRVGDRIVVGVNNLWREAEDKHILINTDIKNAPYSRASFVAYNQ